MATPNEILKQYWGFDQFRPLQDEIIASVLEGRDTLALLPTGGGKSLCFQVPALCQPGICIVVSPLIALMKDQVINLKKKNVPAVAIYSGMSYRDIDIALDNCAHGHYKLLYLSPERLKSDLVQARVKRMQVNLLAIDEAHCISQWGYDFRPPYLEIAELRELLPKVPVIALTATATPQVVQDIQDRLAFGKDSQVFQKSYARSNLSYSVLREEGKEGKLIDILQRVPGTGVVYVRNRRKTKEIALRLRQFGISADYYHAGLDPAERETKQLDWIHDKVRIMVSTNAFGMGIDKPDVRIVVHMDLPDNLEAYFQEAGRAGRDGKKSYAVLLYNDSDRITLERNYEAAFPPLEEARRVYRALGSYLQLAVGGGVGESYDFDLVAFAERFQLKPMRAYNCLKILEQSAHIVLTDAVFVPSSLLIKVSKDELYDYQLKHSGMDRLLKLILRTYQGAFTYPIHIRENQLANFLNITRADITRALELLHQDDIVEYHPQKELPQIIFTPERLDADHLQFNFQLYNFRKQRHEERIRKAITYAEQPRCRNQQLLAYFGETDASACGICDICTGRTNAELDQDSFEAYQQKIQSLLSAQPRSPEELLKAFPPAKEHALLRALSYLIDEGQVAQRGGKLHWTA